MANRKLVKWAKRAYTNGTEWQRRVKNDEDGDVNKPPREREPRGKYNAVLLRSHFSGRKEVEFHGPATQRRIYRSLQQMYYTRLSHNEALQLARFASNHMTTANETV